jgi:transcriptional regulator with XRE-family HTH domain
MDKETRERLEGAGFEVGDAEDFLGLTEDERLLVELRVAVSRAVRRLREAGGVTQRQLAAKLGSSQSRVAKIEAGAPDVSLDLSFRALFAAGGKLTDVTTQQRRRKQAAPRRRRAQRSALPDLRRPRLDHAGGVRPLPR